MSLSQLKGFGPKSQKMLERVGIDSVEVFMGTDPYELYFLLKSNVPGTSPNMLYAIIGAQEDTDWREIAKSRKMEILLRLDDMGLAP